MRVNSSDWGKLAKHYRLLVALMLSLSMILPVIYPVSLPMTVAKEVGDAYNFVESIQERSPVLFTAYLYAAAWPELGPCGVAVVRHLFRRSIRPIFLGTGPESPVLIEKILSHVDTKGKTYGVDWVNLGYVPGDETMLAAVSKDFKVIAKDYFGTSTGDIPLMKGVNTISDVKAAICIDTGIHGLEGVIRQIAAKTPFLIAGVMGTYYSMAMPYYKAGIAKGVLSSTLGAAQYEVLTKMPGPGSSVMSAMSVSHILLIALIMAANIYMVWEKRAREREVMKVGS